MRWLYRIAKPQDFRQIGLAVKIHNSKQDHYCRPDYTNSVEQLLALCGEEKQDEDQFEAAWQDVERKLGSGFPGFSYPNIDAIFCYAAAHKLFQYAVQPVKGDKVIANLQEGPLSSNVCTGFFDFAHSVHCKNA